MIGKSKSEMGRTEFSPAEGGKRGSSSSSSVLSADVDDEMLIIPGLPNDLSLLCLAFIPFSDHSRLKRTSRRWRSALSSRFLFELRREWRRSEEFLCVFPSDPSLTPGSLFDPRIGLWRLLPPMPCRTHRFGLSNFVCVAADSAVFVLGGSLFNARAHPLDLPLPSSSVFSLSLPDLSWQSRSPMLHARAGFACAVRPTGSRNALFVAGGGSRHAEFGIGGSRIGAAEWYDVEKDEWSAVEEELPGVRAGCFGFFLGENEFWVMGGYGDCRTVSGVFPVDDYYRDGAVLSLKNWKWKSTESMWEEGERSSLGSVAVLEDELGGAPGIFMLEGATIFRFNIVSNRWERESPLPRKIEGDPSYGFIAVDGKLHVMSELTSDFDSRRTPETRMRLLTQVYDPKKKAWTCVQTTPPFRNIDFRYAVMCSIRL